MAITTQVPSIAFTSSGPQIPADADILAGVQADQNTAFGGGLNSDLSTPQGQLAQSMAAIISDKNAQILEVINGIDPATNSGRWQDAIARIYFLSRNAGKGTVVTATVSGAVGTVLPAGSTAQDTSGYIYASTASVTIGSTGSAQVQFQNQTVGDIACPAGTLSRIYIAVAGWERITNDAAGTPGSLTENRYSFESRRAASVASNSTAMISSVRAAIMAVSGVIDAYVLDNPLSYDVTVGATNVTIVKNSIYVCVSGGEDADIAAAIIKKKSGGCNYNGDTSYVYTMQDDYPPPYPTYTVKWMAAKPLTIKTVVTLNAEASTATGTDYEIQQIVLAAFNRDNSVGFGRIGAGVYANKLYAAITEQLPSIQIKDISVAPYGGSAVNFVQAGIDQIPVCSLSDISVVRA